MPTRKRETPYNSISTVIAIFQANNQIVVHSTFVGHPVSFFCCASNTVCHHYLWQSGRVDLGLRRCVELLLQKHVLILSGKYPCTVVLSRCPLRCEPFLKGN